MTIAGDFGVPGAQDADADDNGTFTSGLPPLPVHDDEIMSAHEGRPTVEQQARTHDRRAPGGRQRPVMKAHPLIPPDLPDLERLVTRSEVQRITNAEPLTVSQVLAKGYLAMDAEDQVEAERRDPMLAIRAHRQRTLWGRIIDSMTRRQ